MTMTIFLFSKFNRLPFFLALLVSNSIRWECKLPHNILLLKRLTIAIKNCLSNKDPTQNKDANIVGVVCYTVERPK